MDDKRDFKEKEHLHSVCNCRSHCVSEAKGAFFNYINDGKRLSVVEEELFI